MEQWEYKIIIPDIEGWINKKIDSDKLEETLNVLGNDGWELVSANSLTGIASWGSETKSIYFIFKRDIT